MTRPEYQRNERRNRGRVVTPAGHVRAADVRAYLKGKAGTDPARRVRVFTRDGYQPGAVVTVLVAGFTDVEPRSRVADVLADRLAVVLDGTRGVVVHHRGTDRRLAKWVADEMKQRTSITHATTRHVPERRRGGGRNG